MKAHRRIPIVAAVLALAALHCTAVHAQAQDWPSKPIRIIVPYTPGTGQDIIARTLAPKITEKFGQPVVIDNRAGASGNIGMEAVAKAPPDGYTLLMTASTIVLNPLLYKDIGWDPFRDFTPVANITTGYLALVVNPQVKAANVKDFVALLRAQPGKLSYASTGIGTPQHLTGELFKQATNTFMLHVPYKGSAGAITGVIGGDVEAMFMPAHSALPQAKQGRIKVLGVVADKRAAVAPEIPTLQEAGGPNIEASVWYPMYAPAKTPPDIVGKLSAALAEIVKQTDVAETLNKQGLVVQYRSPQEQLQFSRAESARWGQLVKQKNLTAE
jgi:tripartite-type tricarboxylate transporter receptor subunit TctC